MNGDCGKQGVDLNLTNAAPLSLVKNDFQTMAGKQSLFCFIKTQAKARSKDNSFWQSYFQTTTNNSSLETIDQPKCDGNPKKPK